MASQALPNTEVVKARELVEASFARGSAPTASARKTIALMLQKAAGAAWEPGRLFQITKRELRGSHKGNERLQDVLDEVQRTLIRIETMSPAGRHAVEVAPVLTRRIEETDDAEGAIVWFQFSEAARAAMQGSDHYACLNRAAVLAFESRYAVTLYERGCLLVGRHNRIWRGSVIELRQMLGVPPDTYRDWSLLRRFTLDRAVAEVNHLAPLHCQRGRDAAWSASDRGGAGFRAKASGRGGCRFCRVEAVPCRPQSETQGRKRHPGCSLISKRL